VFDSRLSTSSFSGEHPTATRSGDNRDDDFNRRHGRPCAALIRGATRQRNETSQEPHHSPCVGHIAVPKQPTCRHRTSAESCNGENESRHANWLCGDLASEVCATRTLE
jgi:hypothetical protein